MDGENTDDGNAFAIPDLYKTSRLAHFDDDASSVKIDELQPLGLLPEQHLKLPFAEEPKSGLIDLSTFEYGPVEDVGLLEDSSVSSLESLEAPEVVEEDVWTCLCSTVDDRVTTHIKSWEGFYDKRFQDPKTTFLSEAGPRVFDAALFKASNDADNASTDQLSGVVIQSEVVLSSLMQLALGRESILYWYDKEEKVFKSRKNDVRMSGYSLETFNSLSASLSIKGCRMRGLQEFVSRTQKSSRPLPTLVSLAGAFSPILLSLEAQIGSLLKPVRSLLQLQSLVENPGQVLSCLADVVAKVQGAQTDEELLNKLYELVQNAEQSSAWLSSVLHGLLVAASRPWRESVDRWLGLQQNTISGSWPSFPNFVVTGDEGQEYNSSSMPSFIPEEDGLVIFETGRSLRLLEGHEPGHPLTKPTTTVSNTVVNLEWQFSWRGIEKVSNKAKEYESNLRKAINTFPSGKDRETSGYHESSHPESAPGQQPQQSAQDFINSSSATFEKPFPSLDFSIQNNPMNADQDLDDTFAPPLSLLSTLSFTPIISAQARLTDRACLRLLFKGHNLRSHFSLLHRYSLMSDGVFTSRLSHALFDPDLHTTERRKGHPRSTGSSGLQLGHRATWPPASSELRLALMGILTDSYFAPTTNNNNNNNHTNASTSMFRADLPGGLSFAIREMSTDELTRCTDPNSISALDFLRLQYDPPAPLDAVITPTSLERHDAIFQLLLRCTRILFVVTNLSRSQSHTAASTGRRASSRRGGDGGGGGGGVPRHQPHPRFRLEAHHFVTTVCSYFFDCIAAHWRGFSQQLVRMERVADDDSDIRGSGRGVSVYRLREDHEEMLHRLMLALLLRKRQVQVMGLLEEIWGGVLRFAWLLHGGGEGEGDDDDEGPGRAAREMEKEAEIRELHATFRRKVRVFVDVCRGLSGERGPGGTKGEEAGEGGTRGANTLGQLLLRFEMGGWGGYGG